MESRAAYVRSPAEGRKASDYSGNPLALLLVAQADGFCVVLLGITQQSGRRFWIVQHLGNFPRLPRKFPQSSNVAIVQHGNANASR
jgi:hypothetical protein